VLIGTRPCCPEAGVDSLTIAQQALTGAMAASLAIKLGEKQELLETVSIKERLEKIRAVLMREPVSP